MNATGGLSEGRTSRPSWWTIIVVVLGVVVTVCIFGEMLRDFRSDTVAQWSQVHLGDTEESIRASLGSPYRAYTLDSAPIDYYISGYRWRERQITNRVLIYMGADMVLYVWIDRNGRVEDMFSGGS